MSSNTSRRWKRPPDFQVRRSRLITRLSAPGAAVEAVDAEAVIGAEGAGSAGAAEGRADGPFWAGDVPDRGRRLRRRLAVPVFSEAATLVAASTGGAGASATFGGAGDRRPRRLRDGGGAAGTPSAAACRAAWARRRTLAPTSPSAQSAPSAVWTSTRQTTMAVGAPPTGGRFWVSVHRA